VENSTSPDHGGDGASSNDAELDQVREHVQANNHTKNGGQPEVDGDGSPSSHSGSMSGRPHAKNVCGGSRASEIEADWYASRHDVVMVSVAMEALNRLRLMVQQRERRIRPVSLRAAGLIAAVVGVVGAVRLFGVVAAGGCRRTSAGTFPRDPATYTLGATRTPR
jgi:hypothetical protein